MEHQIIDYYNELPSGINVIDKMNAELHDLQKKYNELEKKHDEYVKLHGTIHMPKIRINTIDELKTYAENIYNSVPIFKKIIYDFLNHEGWILEYDRPDRAGQGVMGYAECGFWDTFEMDELKWGDTSAQAFYLDNAYHNTEYNPYLQCEYNLYLKCKLLDELYKLFPEYTERKRGWFHQQIDNCFDEVTLIITTILEDECAAPLLPLWTGTKEKLHDIIYKKIMEQLFGGHGAELFPDENVNSDYIQNIIYYECCGNKIHGENFIETDITEGYCWYDGETVINEEDSFTCPNCGK